MNHQTAIEQSNLFYLLGLYANSRIKFSHKWSRWPRLKSLFSLSNRWKVYWYMDEIPLPFDKPSLNIFPENLFFQLQCLCYTCITILGEVIIIPQWLYHFGNFLGGLNLWTSMANENLPSLVGFLVMGDQILLLLSLHQLQKKHKSVITFQLICWRHWLKGREKIHKSACPPFQLLYKHSQILKSEKTWTKLWVHALEI